jgi:hypothetical protein
VPVATLLLVGLAACGSAWAAPADEITPRPLAAPPRTEWRPDGCRSVPFAHPVLPSRTAFRRAHGDLESTDEVELAYAPVFARAWIAEPGLYQVTTPAFDDAGNLYMTPLLPREPILLLSLDGATGARRFVVPLEAGDRGGGAVPLVLRDPEAGTEVVYVNAYQRVVAVRTDGTTLWSAPTGLGAATTADRSPIGLAWVPNADAVVVLTRDGFVLLHDRKTGAPLLAAPFQVPGERTPPPELAIPPALTDAVDLLLEPFVAFSGGNGVRELIEVLLGGNSKVANNLSVDPRTGRLWIAASERDGADGTVDGVSELGAVYRFDVVRDGAGWTLAEICHRPFPGGSASTPTLGQNGSRVYLGDDGGALIAIDAQDCGDAWRLQLDSQIFGSVAAASDGREVFAASAGGIFQVIDDGDQGRRGWTAALDLYDVPPDLSGYAGMNLLLAGIGANGLLIQAGVGVRTGTQALPVRTGVVHVDRLSGETRWFADGLEESLGAMSTGADGALYLPHAPLRRAFSLALGLTTEPLVGGVSKWASTRDDLLARDAACAAADRAANARGVRTACPESALADLGQVDALRAQALAAAGRAAEAGALPRRLARRVSRLGARVRLPARTTDAKVARYHAKAARALGRACRVLSSPRPEGARARGETRSARDDDLQPHRVRIARVPCDRERVDAGLDVPSAVTPYREGAERDRDLDGLRAPCRDLDALEAEEAPCRTLPGRVRLSAVHLHDLRAVAPARVRDRAADAPLGAVPVDRRRTERERRVGQAEAEWPRGSMPIAVELPLAVPEVVRHGRRVGVERRQMPGRRRNRERKPPARRRATEQDVGERVAALHAGIPQLDDRRHVRPPRFHDDRAAAHDGDDRPGIRGRDRADEGLVGGGKLEAPAVASG